uniref:FAD-binding domain-containing protein n=1 Tax=Chromera velia CCMP2878 TaxID=1169474 RepID=A0A0G4HCJ7_9ALVE|eukprot:Cvel_6326.t1-p1 / transcript=Cvel_6326.t1 / gene=Cvel_6326 / organism=Chromera_velia_CCMP2878 / gene_product=hypothetical protein / transcript_product=hypothetical protein / location=Cvel_scaffold307:30859-33917(+) / protein_length=517 / sequence_SO=supercontig / SO=protein_coding / is_pseudo=false
MRGGHYFLLSLVWLSLRATSLSVEQKLKSDADNAKQPDLSSRCLQYEDFDEFQPEAGTDQRYVVVGAGPVGMWTALQIKLALPKADVTIYEKRSSYTRNHILNLAVSVFKEGFGGEKAYDRIWSKGLSDAVPNFEEQMNDHPERVRVMCRKLEESLRRASDIFGIKVEQLNVSFETLDTFLDSVKDATLVIGADSRHSTMRDVIMPGEDLRKTPQIQITNQFQYNIFMKVMVKATNWLTNKTLRNLTWARTMLNLHDHNAVFIVGGENEDGTVPVTIQMPLVRSEAQPVLTNCKQRKKSEPKCTIWNSEGEHDDRLPSSVARDLDRTIDYLTNDEEENKRLKTETEVSLVLVDTYIANTVAKFKYHKEGRIPMLLIGDAAFGVPYFKGLVNGLSTGNELSLMLVRTLDPLIRSAPSFTAKAQVEFLKAYAAMVADKFSLGEQKARKTSWMFVGQNSAAMAARRVGQTFVNGLRMVTPWPLRRVFNMLPCAVHDTESNWSVSRQVEDVVPPLARSPIK